MNLSIFKFAVRMLVGWEAGKGNVILHGNSSLILKIVINGDTRLINRYYPMPCYSGKHFMLKLLPVVENRRPALWSIPPPPPPIGGIRTPPTPTSPWERTRQQPSAPTFWPFTFDLDSGGETVGNQFFYTFLCLPVSGCPQLLLIFWGQVIIYLTITTR